MYDVSNKTNDNLNEMNEPSELIPILILRRVTIHEVNDTTMIKRSRHEVTTLKFCGTDDDNRNKRNDDGYEVEI